MSSIAQSNRKFLKKASPLPFVSKVNVKTPANQIHSENSVEPK
jgi:hypothetical protein